MGMNIRVINTDKMCFEIDPITLEPKSCSVYDPYAHIDPRNGKYKYTMSIAEWNLRIGKIRQG